jgi:hypothetical protein
MCRCDFGVMRGFKLVASMSVDCLELCCDEACFDDNEAAKLGCSAWGWPAAEATKPSVLQHACMLV